MNRADEGAHLEGWVGRKVFATDGRYTGPAILDGIRRKSFGRAWGVVIPEGGVEPLHIRAQLLTRIED